MKRSHLIASSLCASLAFGAIACQKQDPADPKIDQEAAQKHAQGIAYNESLKTSGDISPEKAKELQKKLKNEHRILPPKPIVKMTIDALSDHLSHADAQRSFLYREAAVKRCYINAIAAIPDAEGTFSLALSRSDNAAETAVDRYDAKGTVANDDFKNCILDMAKRWPLPSGAKLAATFDLSSVPPPTIEELRKQGSGGAYKIAPRQAENSNVGDDAQNANDGENNAQNATDSADNAENAHDGAAAQPTP